MEPLYERLREHLDRLPGGFPATDSKVELRILKRLFTPEEAELAQNLSLKLETAEAIAERLGRDYETVSSRLNEMARKGLIFSIEVPDRPPAYMAAQFLVGIWEYHLNKLDKDFIKDMDEYFPVLAKEAFDHVPQLRTIPVGKSLTADMEVLPYEKAEELIRKQKKILVAPCICRREHQLKGDGCDKLMEACLIFGWGADYYQRNKLGRVIEAEEALSILKRAEEDGLVLQPSNAQEIVNICLCCGDCCQILINLKRHPKPGLVVSSPFVVKADPEACLGCEICLDPCQMAALTMEDDKIVLDADRCIGCGLCVSTCPEGALVLERKPETLQTPVPKNTMEAHALRAQTRAQAKTDLEDKLKRLQQS